MGKKATSSLAEESERFLTRFPSATFVGVTPLFSGHRVVSAPTSDWIIVPSGEDPQVKSGSLHAPRRVRTTMDRLAKSGAPIAALYIAHEVPPGAQERLKTTSLAQELTTNPAEKNAALEQRLSKIASGVAVGATALAGAPLLALGALADGFDPAVLAAVTAPGMPTVGSQASFFHIVSWI